MDKKTVDNELEKANNRNQEILEKFQEDFANKIANDSSEDGLNRMQTLEHIIHTMNSDIFASNMKLVGSMIENLDEESIISSKKENSLKGE